MYFRLFLVVFICLFAKPTLGSSYDSILGKSYKQASAEHKRAVILEAAMVFAVVASYLPAVIVIEPTLALGVPTLLLFVSHNLICDVDTRRRALANDMRQAETLNPRRQLAVGVVSCLEKNSVKSRDLAFLIRVAVNYSELSRAKDIN